MIIHIKNAKSNTVGGLRDSKVQSIPCKILADCEANVSKYFGTSVKVESDRTLSASFRGHPLKGTTINLPEGYVGLVLHESIAPLCEEQERRVHIINKFKSVQYWNWDKAPSQNDKFVQALDWIEIAEVVILLQLFVMWKLLLTSSYMHPLLRNNLRSHTRKCTKCLLHHINFNSNLRNT